MVSQDLIFNVIYVKGTVGSLLPSISTMLTSTSCKYRLVSNGCNMQEESELKSYISTDNRLSFYSVQSETIKSHHNVLQELLHLDNSKYFAFIDSDMIAEDDFVGELLGHLKDYDAVFTGLPLWHEKTDWVIPKKHNIMGGLYLQSHHGLNLSVTYCAIYNRKMIQDFIEKTGISFDIYYWAKIPKNYQKTLRDLELKKYFYDTSKVLNILWQHSGAKISYQPVKGLLHLGGISGDSNNSSLSVRFKQFLLSNLPFWLTGMIRAIYKTEYPSTIQESKDLIYLAHRRRTTQTYFDKVTSDNFDSSECLNFKKLPPQYPQKIMSATEKILKIKSDFRKENITTK